MLGDTRYKALYDEAILLTKALRQPGAGRVSDATDISTDGNIAVFSGIIAESLELTPQSRICTLDLSTGAISVMTAGPNIDRAPKLSNDGKQVAFLSDRGDEGNFQLYFLNPKTGAITPAPVVDGWVEYLHWSPDGKRILLGVAGRGADLASGQGAISSKQVKEKSSNWKPVVEAEPADFSWRRVWVYECSTNEMRPIGAMNTNIWEAVWCGDNAITVINSPEPGEGAWYTATLGILGVESDRTCEIYRPMCQLGWPASTPSGRRMAVVEAICSDRGYVAGNLTVIDTATNARSVVSTRGVDVTHLEWRSERNLLLAGHRGLETVIGVYDADLDAVTEVWSSQEITTGGKYVTVSGLGDAGDCLLIGEGFFRAPEIGIIRQGLYRPVTSLGLTCTSDIGVTADIERIGWDASDGSQLEGWLLRPKSASPSPLLLSIHGGPIWLSRPTWLGRTNAIVLMLIRRGFAIFLPNPRGSTGRGQAFAQRVVGDMGGADAEDMLLGIDYLVSRGIADSQRLCVTGVSYGGFMTAWLVTQDMRFAAAVCVAPITNFVTERLLSNISQWVKLFLGSNHIDPLGAYFNRSPVMHAHKVRTPTLNICGARDRCTPPEEAAQFHHALMENGTKSCLVTYPEEGHGIRGWPAIFDYAARVVAWFEDNAPAAESK